MKYNAPQKVDCDFMSGSGLVDLSAVSLIINKQGPNPISGTLGTIQSYYSRDHLGSVRTIYNQYTEWAAADYDPFGKISGANADIGYTGHYYHAKSGLHLVPFRAYDADSGRWLSRDPIEEEGGLNLYGYVENDPINWNDPLGLSTDKYVPDTDKHGAPHIDRYTKNGQNVGRYRPDGTPVKHKGKLPPGIPGSDKKKFQKAADECKRKTKLRDGMMHTTGDEALQVLAIMESEGALPSAPTPQAPTPTPPAPSGGGSGGTITYNGKTYISQNGVLTLVP